MDTFTDTKTYANLKRAFASESQANRRYIYFARQADVEGYPEIAGLFRDTAEGETGHAAGHLDWLKASGDPVTGLPIGTTAKNLAAAIAGETHEFTEVYPQMAQTAREEGLPDIADWFEALARAAECSLPIPCPPLPKHLVWRCLAAPPWPRSTTRFLSRRHARVQSCLMLLLPTAGHHAC